MDTAFAVHGVTTGAMRGAMLLALWWRRGESTPVVVGITISLIGMIAVKLWTPIAWPWYTTIGAALTLVVAFGVRAVSKPLAVGMTAALPVMVVIELWKQIAWPWHSVVGIATTFGVGFLLTAILDKKREKCH